MSGWLYRWLSIRQQKAASFVAYQGINTPAWTPRRYDTLAEEGYQKNVIVYRCVNLIMRGIASVPWLLYEQNDSDHHELEEHPLLDLIRVPSPVQAGTSFREKIVAHLLLSGNAYIEVLLDADGYPREMYVLRPDRVRVIPGQGSLPAAYEYRVGEYVRKINVDPQNGCSRLLHIKHFNPLNDWYGMSPIEAAAVAIDQHNAVAGHNLALLQNGGRPTGALLFKGTAPLTEAQRETLRSDIKDIYSGQRNAGKVLMLEGDFSWQEMGLSPKDLDFISGKNLSAREIAQAYGIPPMLVGVPGDATFANYREARLHLWEDTILPLLELIIAEFNLWLTPFYNGKLYFQYDHDGIPALSERREAAWSKLAKVNFLTINEKRQAIGYTPISGGDRLEVV